jgi:hypothetical protein
MSTFEAFFWMMNTAGFDLFFSRRRLFRRPDLLLCMYFSRINHSGSMLPSLSRTLSLSLSLMLEIIPSNSGFHRLEQLSHFFIIIIAISSIDLDP